MNQSVKDMVISVAHTLNLSVFCANWTTAMFCLLSNGRKENIFKRSKEITNKGKHEGGGGERQTNRRIETEREHHRNKETLENRYESFLH